MKECNLCGQIKADNFFYPKRRKCKLCCSKESMQNFKIKSELDDSIKLKRNLYLKNYRVLNKDKRSYLDRKDYIIDYNRKRINSDVSYKILKNLRCRLYHCAKGSKRVNSYDLCGITSKELRAYLESNFLEGMSWDNYGLWHIDHIKPCKLFDLTNIMEQKKCFHYTNLQPLWATDNKKKGARYDSNVIQSSPTTGQDSQGN